eukprot:CAMPEP_0172521044 /NCGR_PEP_ID=MMETSP1066-20121228/292350_1 /TAXON_ID=671091 /ORGANISM="Coscinodiscus wailesii, Strain CCMP2513" /LENGTH=541 /DNA_ID=CAMNT_0013303893 /DNA_START=256 /DNA_END=1881 /DNA_ORIENTATION=-
MLSCVTAFFSSNRFRKSRPLHVCPESDKSPHHRQSFDKCEYLQNIGHELNNVAVDLYNGGDYATAIDLYRDAAKAVMEAASCKENAKLVIDEELRAGFIEQIVRGKQQIYESSLLSQSRNDNLESYQWAESGDDGGPRCVSEGLKIESDQSEDLDDEYIIVATITYNTGLIHMKNGELDIAETCFNLAIECFDLIAEKRKCNNRDNSTNNSLLFADLLNNIGYMQYRDGNITKAKNTFTKALEIGKNMLSQARGDYKKKIIQEYKHVGTIYYNNITKAKNTFTKALEIGKNILGQTRGDYKKKIIQEYKHVGTIYYNVGVINARQGLNNEVIRPLQCSIELQKVALGESHPDIAIVYHSIGSVLIDGGQWNDAMNSFLESLRITRFVYGNDNSEVAKELFNIAKVHEVKGEYKEALHAYEETLRIKRLTLGVFHPETVKLMYQIGQIYQNEGDINKALNVYHDILSVVKTASDIEELPTISILGEIITIYLENGNIGAALELFAEVADTIELDNVDEETNGYFGLSHIRDLLKNIPPAAAA